MKIISRGLINKGRRKWTFLFYLIENITFWSVSIIDVNLSLIFKASRFCVIFGPFHRAKNIFSYIAVAYFILEENKKRNDLQAKTFFHKVTENIVQDKNSRGVLVDEKAEIIACQ